MGKQCMYVCMPMGWTDKEGRWYTLLMGKQCMYVCMPMGWTDKEGRWYTLLMGKQCMYYTHGNHYSMAA